MCKMKSICNNKLLFLAMLLCLVLPCSNLLAGPDNIAVYAKVTVSSELNEKYAANNVIDGLISIPEIGEWASDATQNFWGGINYPWIQLNWEQPQLVDKIIFYDRVDVESHMAGGTLKFSDGTELSVNLIKNDGSASVVTFDPKEVKWVRFIATDGFGKNLGFSEIEVYPSTEGQLDPVSMVDPYIETTRGRFFFFVTGSRPFGMISSAPMTRNKNQFGGGYNYNSTEILSFPQVHNWSLGGIEFMPATGEINPSLWHNGWKSKFSHDGEIVQPGYHRVFLHKYKTWVEQTCTERVSFYRMRYTEDGTASMLFNLGGYVSNSTMTGAVVSKFSDTEIEGSFNAIGRLWGGPKNVKIFFVARFDKPMIKIG